MELAWQQDLDQKLVPELQQVRENLRRRLDGVRLTQDVLTEWEADLKRELSNVATRFIPQFLEEQGQVYCDELRDWVTAFAARPPSANWRADVDEFLAQQKQARIHQLTDETSRQNLDRWILARAKANGTLPTATDKDSSGFDGSAEQPAAGEAIAHAEPTS